MTTETTMHPFERAGLGKAPFRFVGMIEQDLCYGEAILNRAEYQQTGIRLTTKPGGSCDYCGTYIVNMFRIASADGKTFKVGCDCVSKTGDAKLVKAVKAETTKRDREKRQVKAAARKAARQASPATAAQLGYLRRLGCPEAELEGLTLGAATDAINAAILRTGRQA